MSLNNAATTTETRFDSGGQLRELNEAVSLARQTLELNNPSHPLHSKFLDNLADTLLMQFQKVGRRSDLDEAISFYRQALELRPSPDPLRPDSLNNLSKALLIHFREGGQPSDLNEALSLPKQALELQPPTHPLRSMSLHNLALALWRQFERTGQKSDLDESISMHEQAVELRAFPHPLRSDSLDSLGIALWTKFVHGGDRINLDKAISVHRQALELRPSPHPLRSMSLNNLASALKIKFAQEGHQSELDEAILLHRQALELRPPPHPLRSSSLSNLASVLKSKFDLEGHQSDMDEAILLHRQALELRPPPHPFRAVSLNNLADVLWTRFGKGGHESDLDEAILLHRQALELLGPSTPPTRSKTLMNLARALRTRFEKDGHRIDVDEAISLNREALRFHSNHYKADLLNTLGDALHTRFQQEGHQTDLNEAISLHREALDLRNLSEPSRSESLNNLANALRTKFEQEGQKTELNEAILLYRQALELRPSPNPDQSRSLYDLGIGLLHAHSLTARNASDYLDEAIELFRAATQCLNQPASLRLRIAHTWIKYAVLHRHTSAIDAYDAALQALPKLAALTFNVKSRQEALLNDSDGLARTASRFAIQAGRMNKAIEFLEAGRAIFWSQFLSLRSPFEQLRDIAPELVVKLRDTATALELGSHRDALTNTSENREKLIVDRETARLNRLNEEWSKAIDDVRQLNGFEDFLRTRSVSGLRAAASEGPVVMLVENNDGSDILILTSVNVSTIRLSGLPTKELQTLVDLTQAASSNFLRFHAEDHSRNTAEFPPAIEETLRNWMLLREERGVRPALRKDSDTVFRFVLETLWNEVVKPVIDLLDLKKSEELPVVQWCPTGLFSFLPIHAAGCYDDRLGGECASDYFISSYTPTIGALLTQERTLTTEPFKMMAVIQSRELPSTLKELERIEQHVSDDFLVKLGVAGASASVEAVASRLSDVAIVHFSCHGTQDRSNPLDSGLKLDDGLLRVSRIMKEKIPNGALAFLCACETAMGDDKLPDEAMSLGASLLYSGFRRVVATMWAMRDEDGPVIADAFYEKLFRGPDGKPTREPDTSKSAYALHMAVKKLRSKKVLFRRWVPFIHMGK